MLNRAAAILDRAATERLIPGMVLRVQHQGRLLHESAHGVTRFDLPSPVLPSTWFDLASLTKILATIPLAMLMMQSGEIDLDAPLGEYLPAVHSEFSRQPFWRFLNHISGAAAWKSFFRRLAPGDLNSPAGKQKILAELLSELPEYEPGTRQVYSDIGMALVGAALEKVGRAPIHELAANRVFAALPVDGIAFLQQQPRSVTSIAATEDCPWRGRVICGEVHDENTWAAGGALGQSGLFGTAEAVCRVMEEFRVALNGQGRLFNSATLARFMKQSTTLPGASFRLGFDSPSPGASSTGKYFGARTFGHLGYTGVSVWCDPDRALIVVLLTNRVHPTRQNIFIKQLRPLIHDAVIEELADESR